MSTTTATLALRHLRRSALLREDADLPDAQLLERYLARRDDSAFESLLLRHGPMVLGVCRRVLGNEADAEDAFQATFLVLVLKAASIRSRSLLGNWLYGVAHHTAQKAKAMIRTRRAKEAIPKAAVSAPADLEVHALLEAELHALPEKYRAAIVACDLEGKTIQAASALLGWAQGTTATRLRRGRAMLGRRLAARGVTFSAAVFTAVAVPSALLSATGEAAASVAAGQSLASGVVSAAVARLIQGVMDSMFLTKLKPMLIATAVVFLGLSGSLMSQYLPGGVSFTSPAPAQARPEDSLKNTLLALDKHLWEASSRGDWQERQKFFAADFVSVSVFGKTSKADMAATDQHVRRIDPKIADVEVARVSKDVAMLSYRYSCKVTSAEGKLVDTWKDHYVSYTWANRKGGWVIVFCHDDHGRQAKGQSFARFADVSASLRLMEQHTMGLARVAIAAQLPDGEWDVEFANGVTQKVSFGSDKTVKVVDSSSRTAVGKAADKDGAVVVTYADDRVERWTKSGKRMIVEHWFPAAAFANRRPVLGVGEPNADGDRKLVKFTLKHITAAEAERQLLTLARGQTYKTTVDSRANSLLIYATQQQLGEFKALLEKMDVPK